MNADLLAAMLQENRMTLYDGVLVELRRASKPYDETKPLTLLRWARQFCRHTSTIKRNRFHQCMLCGAFGVAVVPKKRKPLGRPRSIGSQRGTCGACGHRKTAHWSQDENRCYHVGPNGYDCECEGLG